MGAERERGIVAAADDLARIEQPSRIEDLFDSTEHPCQIGIETCEEPGPRQPQALFASDRAPHRHHLGVDRLGEPDEAFTVGGIGGIGVGTDMELPMRGVAEDHGGRRAAFEHTLQPREEVGERLGGHDDVLDERHRAGHATDPMERGDEESGEIPELRRIPGVVGPADVDAQALHPLDAPDGVVEPGRRGRGGVGGEFDEQAGVGDRRDEEIEIDPRPAGQRQMSLVEQVAGTGEEGGNSQARLPGLLERIEEEEGDGRRPVRRHRPQRRLRHDSQGPCRPADQAGQVDKPVVKDVVEPVASMGVAPGGLSGRDHLRRVSEEFVDPHGQGRHACRRVERRGGLGATLGQRARTGHGRLELHDRAIGENDLRRREPATDGAVKEKAAAGGVAADHATDGGDGGGGRIGAERAATPPEMLLELETDHPRLHAHGLVGRGDDAAEEAGAVDHHSGPE